MKRVEKIDLIFSILSEYGDISKSACEKLIIVKGLVNILNQGELYELNPSKNLKSQIPEKAFNFTSGQKSQQEYRNLFAKYVKFLVPNIDSLQTLKTYDILSN